MAKKRIENEVDCLRLKVLAQIHSDLLGALQDKDNMRIDYYQNQMERYANNYKTLKDSGIDIMFDEDDDL